jgi:hypothetical protein
MFVQLYSPGLVLRCGGAAVMQHKPQNRRRIYERNNCPVQLPCLDRVR